jgi:siroheme synthase
VVIMMGVGRRALLASHLVARGWAPSTPAAIVSHGSRPTQTVWRGTLQEIAQDQAVVAPDAPAVIVIGEVAALDLAALPRVRTADAFENVGGG